MRQDQLDGLITFIHVAEHSSFSGAAARLGVSPSAVSQAIRALEGRLGIALFNRTTRSVSLTEAGAGYLERISPLIQDVLAATEEVGRRDGAPSGLLRLNVPRLAYMAVLQPILRDFLDAHPQISLEATLDNRLMDVAAVGYDAGIRFGDLVEKDMVAVKVGPPLSAHIIASPGYLARRGTPQAPHDLLQHDCINMRHATTGQVERWAFARAGEAFELAVPGRLTLNDSAALVQAVLDGLGIAYMVNGYIDRFLADGRLVRLLPDWSPDLAGMTLYYPDRRRVPPKLRALIDFLRHSRPAIPHLDAMVG